MDSVQTLPSCPYQWPNGQGDVGKFLKGIENSRKWEKDYGGIYRIWSGTSSEMRVSPMKLHPARLLTHASVLTRPEHLKAVFRDSDKHKKAVDNNSGYLMSRVLGKCVGLVSGKDWQTLRKVTEVPFQHKATTAYTVTIQNQIKQYLEDLRHESNLSNGFLDPALDMKMLPFWIVAEVVYGKLTHQMVSELKSLAPLREELFLHVITGGLSRFAFSRFLPTKANFLLRTFQERWSAFNEEAYTHAKRLESDAPIVSMFDAVHTLKISYEQLYQTLDESLYANLDVTTGGLSWNLVFLAADQVSQERLRAEVIENQNDIDGYVRKSSTFLAACILESSRLKPLAAFSVPQSAPTDRVVDGYLIPAGTNFVTDSYSLNIHNDFWAPDTEVYRPERWLNYNTSDLRYHFWRFGFGPRQCMGKYIAESIIRLFLVEILTSYSLELVNKEDVSRRDPNSWITHPQCLLRCTRV